MLNESDFINKIWEKYDTYSKTSKAKKSFFDKDIYKHNHFMIHIQSFALCLTVIVCTILLAGGVYATLKNTPKQEKGESLIIPFDNMIYDETTNLYYQEITSYKDYCQLRNSFNVVPEMKESDFEQVSLLVVASKKEDNKGIFIALVMSSGENTVKVSIAKDEKKSDDIAFLKMKKRDNRNIQLAIDTMQHPIPVPNSTVEDIRNKVIKVDSFEDLHEQLPNVTNHVPLSELPENYSKEQAIQDNCIVLEDYHYINGYDKIREFYEESKKGINGSIRVVTFSDSGTQIADVEYKNGRYIYCNDNTRYKISPEEKKFVYVTVSKMKINEMPDGRGFTHTDYDFCINIANSYTAFYIQY